MPIPIYLHFSASFIQFTMTSACITYDQISSYWTRFKNPADRADFKVSAHAAFLCQLSEKRFHKYPGELNRGLWEDGPTDFSRPWLCTFDYTKVTAIKLGLSTVADLFPDGHEVVPGNIHLSAAQLSQSLNATTSKRRFGIFNYKHTALAPKLPRWIYENSIVHQVNSRNCSKCPEWLPLDNYIQLATAWTHSDFHIDKGNTAAFVGLIEGEKLVIMILDRNGLHTHYSAWHRARLAESNSRSFWYVGELEGARVIVTRIRAGELLYIPPGRVHFVLTLKSCITISGNFFHKNFIPSIARTWTFDFVGRHSKPCGLKGCNCDHHELGYNRRVCTLLTRFAALVLNKDATMPEADKRSLGDYIALWGGFQRNHIHYRAFQEHAIEECSCSLPKRMIEDLLFDRKVKSLLPVDGGNWPGWKSSQPYVIRGISQRHFTDVFEDLPNKKPRLD